ncbi:MAG: phosphate ABC transporter substrate-binding protein [Moraxellaceae bacterium]|nr:phosphate ABC transporter substrate-binding protein [Moraxellaceae bacterium]MDZ4385725.1 phosphate ABC transporter substrate-binding protein [Moraxellaceae bacterium]
MVTSRACIVALLVLLLPTLSWAQTDRLVITGASSLAPLVQEIATRFEQKHPSVRVEVQSGGTGRGITDARRKLSQIGMVSRALKAEESDLIATTIAIDGVAIIVHSRNPISNLTNTQIQDIYRGKVTNWQQAGGTNQRITVVNKADGRSTLEVFSEYFTLPAREIRAHAVIGDNQQGIKQVAGNPGAIGYVSIGAAQFEVLQGTPIKLLPLNKVPATIENVAKGRFPMSRPLNLVTSGKPTHLATRFIEFATSSAVDDLITGQYLVPPAR